MQFVTMTFYFVITLGVLIFIHEFGHFLTAKLMGMRVDRFSIGFPPRAFGKKFGETDYCVSWVPIGGYVKIAGMVDESFDTDYLAHEAQPWEFRSKPLAARVLVISAGVIMNVLLALAIFTVVHHSQGKQIDLTTDVGYVVDGGAAQKSGVLAGDKILAVNGAHVAYWEQIEDEIFLENIGNDIRLEMDRSGKRVNVTIPRKMLPDSAPQQLGMYEAPLVPAIGAIEPGKPAEKLGLMAGDDILALDDSAVNIDQQVVGFVQRHANKPMKLTWRRNGKVFSGLITPTDQGKIGIRIGNRYSGPTQHVQYSLPEAVGEGFKDVIQAPVLFFVSIKQIIVGKMSFKDSFGGPIKIAQYATESASYGLLSYLYFLAQISMALATINILPFPALDGGHLAMMLVERVFRREIPNKVKIAIQQAGFVLILALMAFVIYNDIMHF
jgi:regulator of sigma E protease